MSGEGIEAASKMRKMAICYGYLVVRGLCILAFFLATSNQCSIATKIDYANCTAFRLGLWGKERRGVPLKSIPVSFLGDVAKSACEVAQQERGVALVARRSVASLLKRGPSIEFLGNLLDMLACLFKCNMHGSKGPAWLPALYRPRELI
eukprot:scaffold10630_cov16-Tisochrysis_lutea.AAC.2